VLFWLSSGCLLIVRGVVLYYIEVENWTIIVTPKSNTVEQVGIGGLNWVFFPGDLLKIGLSRSRSRYTGMPFHSLSRCSQNITLRMIATPRSQFP